MPVAAGGLALFAGLLGLAPHFAWSLENHAPSWFFNSYDEGFYGWLGLKELIVSRLLATGIMRSLLLLGGGNTQVAMMLADFLLPLAATLAACYALRPLFPRPVAMAAAALFLVTAPELVALRSSLIPHASWYDWLSTHAVPLFGGPSGWLQIDNRTATFWLFRTPEPQISLTLAFIALGLALRVARSTKVTRSMLAWLLGVSALLGIGYMFIALSVAGVFLVYGVLAFRCARIGALAVGGAGAVITTVCFATSLAASRQLGGDKFLFPSRDPVLLLSMLPAAVAAAWLIFRIWRNRRFEAPQLFGLALSLTPVVVANQQLLTGHMIYLMNFENFGLAQIAGFALLVALAPAATIPSPAPRRFAALPAALVLGLLAWLLGRSQVLSYRSYLAENRLTESYVHAVREHLPTNSRDTLACGDFFVTDILAVKLGRRPDYVLSRDTTFLQPVKRLVSAAEFPANGAIPRHALFRHLAASRTLPAQFARDLTAVIDPAYPDWKNRFMLGAFLYNQADFWSPMTHARDLRSEWIAAQRPRLVREYEKFLAAPAAGDPVELILLPVNFPMPLTAPGRRVTCLTRTAGTAGYPLAVYRNDPITTP